MSHFSVFVVGNVDYQLAPFHEFECTGQDDEFVVSIDDTERLSEIMAKIASGMTLAEATEYFGLRILKPGETPDLTGEHKYNYTEVDENGTPVRCVRRTNPNAKWDWYVVGGRWSNELLCKDGTLVNSCRKADLDWEGMKRKERERAEGVYRDFHTLIENASWYSYNVVLAQVVEEFPDMPEKEQHTIARSRYWGQPAFAGKERNLPWNPDVFLVSFEEYVAANSSAAPYAYVQNRTWYARGRMGWFGVSHDEQEPQNWDQGFDAMLASLDDDETLTMVDCHI